MNKPEKKFRAGAISATIWKNNGERNGQSVEFNTISLTRAYKDKGGNWKNSSSLRISDLPKAALVLNKAYEHLIVADDLQIKGEDLTA
ncbi:hypothetical protein GF358_00850 [Candidatus Woesearchaeota archaeon]|nr:hypothetical protein [Candidatus Woesearchaeota archaeon]